MNRIKFDNDIILEKNPGNGEQRLRFNITQWWVKGRFYIIHDINKNVTSVQCMDIVVNVNHKFIIVLYWIFYSNYKKSLLLTS